MRRIGLIAKSFDVKLFRGKDEMSTRSRHFVIGLIVLSVGAFVLLHALFDVVHQSSDRYKGIYIYIYMYIYHFILIIISFLLKETQYIEAKINADPLIAGIN